ncbi:hypothetical protein [Roseomonas sp. AR75]|uniref:hypothetical protein n=1 Tax=Roseomonas sp. AR75 TaxID=2562311 RepID=UPI0010BF6981|nr:hypothetical protein [Roseomonas sp. AR75]
MNRKFSGTYEELQGIPTLREFWRKICGATKSDPDLGAAKTFWSASLIGNAHSRNLVQEASAALLDGNLGRADRLIGWALAYVLLERKLLDCVDERVLIFQPPLDFHSRTMPFRQKSEEAITFLNQSIMSFIGEARICGVLKKQGLDRTRARLVHNARILNFISGLCRAKHVRAENALLTCDTTSGLILEVEKDLNSLVESPMENAGESLGAFRGIHQIPELLAIFFNKTAHDYVNCADVRERELILYDACDVLNLMIESLHILFLKMTPRAYHQIRDHLGDTSGSQSDAISRKLMRESALAIFSLLNALDRSNLERRMLARLSILVRSWRDIHIMFPLFYLGSRGVRSLMGSPDALSATIRMRDSIQGKDGFYPVPDVTESSALEGIEGYIQPALSSITKRRFADVQERTGFYARRGKK